MDPLGTLVTNVNLFTNLVIGDLMISPKIAAVTDY